MSKSSTVTVREKPVEEVASAKVGGLTIHGETIVVQTDQRIELVDLTNRVMEFVRRFNIREGLVSLWSMHTTCSLFINEFQTALLSDIKRFLEQMVARDAEWMHNNPGALRLRSDERRLAPARAAARPQPDAAGQRRGSRARAMAAHPDGRARRPARALAADTDLRRLLTIENWVIWSSGNLVIQCPINDQLPMTR